MLGRDAPGCCDKHKEVPYQGTAVSRFSTRERKSVLLSKNISYSSVYMTNILFNVHEKGFGVYSGGGVILYPAFNVTYGVYGGISSRYLLRTYSIA